MAGIIQKCQNNNNDNKLNLLSLYLKELCIMFFVSSDEEESEELKIQRRTIRQKSDIFSLPDSKSNRTSIKPVLNRRRASSISNTIKLAATLRFFAQGSHQLNVGNDFNLGLAQPTVSVVLSEILDALEATICPQWIKFSMTEQEKNETEQTFYQETGFPGIIGCVDGMHIKIGAPEKEIQHLYYNRKGYHTINAMIICDHKMRIRFLDARHAGSTIDSLIWNRSPVRKILRKKFESDKRNSWLLGDAEYPLEPFLMTPYRPVEPNTAESVYNTKHAEAISIVKRTIRVLKSRFRCLGDRQLYYKPAKVTKIANVCAALHNICIQYGTHIEVEDSFIEDDLQNDSDGNFKEETIASIIRNEIKQSFV